MANFPLLLYEFTPYSFAILIPTLENRVMNPSNTTIDVKTANYNPIWMTKSSRKN